MSVRTAPTRMSSGAQYRDPYRLTLWSTGGMGRVAISTVASRPDFEIVGARVYAAENDGADIGTLARLPATCVHATTDAESALAVDADCVLHLARDFGRYDSVDEIVAMLRAGLRRHNTNSLRRRKSCRGG
jgi:hypothetical protein